MHNKNQNTLSSWGMFILASLSLFANANEIEKKQLSDVEVIEVYAQKRPQNLQDISVPVTVIQGEAVENLHLKDTTQLAGLAPNVKVTNNAGEGTPPAFNIRGVGMIDYNTSTVSPIAIYNDGIVSGSANNLSVNLFDIEQIEILRGPQGTLFGRNTTGGAILVRSKMPENEFGGYINTSIAQHSHSAVDFAINVPLTNSTAARFSLNHDDYTFSTNNIMDGQPDGGLKQTNYRLIIQSEFDDLIATFKIHGEDWTGKPKPIASNGVLKSDGSGMCTPNQAGSKLCKDAFERMVGGDDYWDVNADTQDRSHDTESWGSSLTLSWQLNEHTNINSITGYRELERFHSWDSDGPGNLIEGDMGTDNSLFSQELSMSFEGEIYFWQSGVFYLKEELTQNNSFDLFRDFRTIPSLASIPAQFFYNNTLENSSFALYSQVDYSITSSLTLTAGLRYTDEETTYHAKADLDTVAYYVPELWNIHGKVADDELSGKVAINKAFSKYTNVYASFTRGYKSGGYNAGYSTSPQQAADSEYAPEILNAYEVGTKLARLNGNLRWQLSAFYYDYQDQQVFVNVPDNVVPYHVLKNAGDSTIYGLESELSYTPTNDLELVLNIGYLPKANIGEYQQDNIIVNDNRLPFSSKWNINSYVVYETDINSRKLTTRIGLEYQSEFFFDQNENIYTQQDGYTLLNGQLSYQLHPEILISVWGKNITNTEYAELRFDSIAALGAITELKGEKRQFGIALKYTF